MKLSRKSIGLTVAAALAAVALVTTGQFMAYYPTDGLQAASTQDWIKLLAPAAASIISAILAMWPTTSANSTARAMLQLLQASMLHGQPVKLTATITFADGEKQDVNFEIKIPVKPVTPANPNV